MREILFRGKRIDNGEWVDGIPWIFSKPVEKAIIVCAMGLFGEDDDVSRYCESYEVDPSTVGMCVPGVTDKNGKKIFEGDILDYFGISYVVSWSKELLTYIVTSVNEKKDYLFYLNKANMDKVYVIGNIHDNPELLEVEE